MQHFFGAGHAIDLVIGVLALEAAWLWWTGRSRLLPLPTLLAGLFLLLAWRAAQAGQSWVWVALPLTAAGLAHGWDLWRRWAAGEGPYT
jgi:hypothetical protein